MGRPLLNTAKFLAAKTSDEEEEQLASGPPVPVSDKDAEPDTSSILAGRESSELEPTKEKSDAAMTSAAHKDKI